MESPLSVRKVFKLPAKRVASGCFFVFFSFLMTIPHEKKM